MPFVMADLREADKGMAAEVADMLMESDEGFLLNVDCILMVQPQAAWEKMQQQKDAIRAYRESGVDGSGRVRAVSG